MGQCAVPRAIAEYRTRIDAASAPSRLCTAERKTLNESRNDLPRLPQEPRRLRGDAGAGRAGRAHAHADAREADVLVVNTCAFIDRAKQESIDAILEMAELKKTGACQRLVVTGCLAERYRDELQEQIPEIDARARHRRSARDRRALRRPRHRARPTRTTGTGGQAPAPYQVTLHRTGPERHQPLGARTELPDLHLRRRDAAPPGDAEALRVREGGRGLRLHVRVLHHPAPARALPSRARPTRSCARRSDLGRAWREGAAAHQPGHDVLRQRPRRARRARPPAPRAERGGRPRVDPAALPLPDDHRRRRCSRRWPSATRSCKYIDLPLQHASDAVLKRMQRPGHAQVATSGCSTTSGRASPASRCAPPSSSASPARPTADFDELDGFRRRGRLRPRRRLHVLARRGHARPASGTTTCRRRRSGSGATG